MTEILDGKALSKTIKARIAEKVKQIVAEGGKKPHLAAILVGEDPASQTYVNSKEKDCKEVGFDSTVLRLPASISEKELLDKIKELDENPNVDGLIIQLPLPAHIDENKVIMAVSPEKDVDGFHPVNVGKMILGLPSFVSATPLGIMTMLKEYGIETKGKNCVVLGRSNIVGRPIANLLSQKSNPGDCTVTICHSHTKNIREITLKADIIVVAIGISEFLKGDMVKEGAVIIDVGITRVADASKKSGFRLLGDVEYSTVAPKASYITPVPGGVGPMTRVALLMNTLKSREQRIS
ncbi:MAG: bifunctional methylenetetrahydrofolate dehydrogenase/methenyltetrahydrofolate cyclohydrolase FolD [Bacteroidales bacterium]|jgi:methylenetetrahydrofolate dehydrogenase (NADP+)/methenyltetrahydrofolate cyclohydrolase|nr:bifunctional methylenetetrahydrofolate dehydrogenase/methenyltetrahydrofolate cyclohydrolase FolD [Bacteroidales bacterium]